MFATGKTQMVDINTEEIFKKLKKQHGETFAKIMRGDEDHNGDLCAIPNILHILEFAGRNPDEARQLRKVIQEIYLSKERSVSRTTKNPLQLLSDAGYEAFVVKTEQQKNSIEKYYRPNERLCTFGDPERHINYYMIHAIKKEVLGDDKLSPKKWHIQPSDKPERQDEYGTSVISIQIARSGGFISIKNRYNHTIANPDATFGNNPDNIIPGLSDALKKYFHVEFNTTNSQLPDNFRMVNDQLVRFNYETNNIYFGPDYYFSGSTITKLKDDGSQLLFYDGFILNMAHDNSQIISVAGADSEMCYALNKYIHGKKIKVIGAKGTTKTILLDGERFMDVTDGAITFVNMSTWRKVQFDSMRGVKLSGELDFSGVKHLILKKLDLCNVTGIKFNPNAASIILNKTIKLSGSLDFSNVKTLDLSEADLTDVTDIKFNPNADAITLDETKIKLLGNPDFSDVDSLNIRGVDLTGVSSIKFNPYGYIVNLTRTRLSGGLDFSNVKLLTLCGADLTDVTDIKFNRRSNMIDLSYAKLSGDLDFSNMDMDNIDLQNADLTRVNSIKFPNTGFVDLYGVVLAGNWDFSNCEQVRLSGADLTRVTSIKFPDSENIDLEYAKLGGKWDFSNVKKFNLMHADLTQVTEIIFPDKEFVNLKGAVLAGDWDFSDIGVVRLSYADLTSVTGIKFNPNAMFMGDIDDADYPCFVSLTGADLRNANLNPIFNLKDGYVNLSWAKLSGDLDFSDVAELKLHNADFTNVKSIKLSWPIYKQIKGQKCKIHGIDVAIADLPRHRIKIIKQNPFIVAKKKLQENLFSKITRKLEQKKLVKSIGRDGRKPQ